MSTAGADEVAVDRWLDERGRRCPIPVIALARAQREWLATLTEAAAASPDAAAPSSEAIVVGVLADDPAAQHDIPAWCRLKGATYLGELPPADGGAGSGYVVRFTGGRPAAAGSSSA